jgi:3-dehydroquinate dehydratase II
VTRYLVLNGPNLNLLGLRDPAVYGSTTLEEVEDLCRGWGAELEVEIDTHQTNHEGELIDRLHASRESHDGVVFNPGAFSHTSYALHDAIDAIAVPTVEVHISNVAEREEWRRTSVVRPACVATMYGRGVDGYRWAIRHLTHRREWEFETMRYADHSDTEMDVRLPSGEGPHPAVVLVHGGFWRHMWTRDTMDGLAIDLARRGYLTANVEYRRVGTGGGWPRTVQDVASAIEAVAGRRDVSSVAAIGHSAGGQLVLMAARFTETSFLPISLGGVLDLEMAIADDVGGGAPLQFLGTTEAAVASPTASAADVPAVAVHGVDDDRVPVVQSRSFAAVNHRCELVELDGVGHFEFLERSDPAWLRVTELLATHVLN